jgi:hypothetical protein
MNDENKAVRLIYEPGESGWGVELVPATKDKGSLVRVNNIPFTDKLNIDDIVETEHKNGCLAVKRAISRAFKNKSAVRYPPPHQENFDKLAAVLREAGCKIEGFLPGLMAVAHEDQDVRALVKEIGIDANFGEPQPSLEPI